MSRARLPDFFILGAPKCGTTALYRYLHGHPEIFMPALKEPHYFCKDYPRIRLVKEMDAYQALFAGAPEGALMGEASTWYLFSKVALSEILKLKPGARLMIALRRPADAARSLHAQMMIGLREDIADFESAWRAQPERALGKRLPFNSPDPDHLQYGRVYSFSDQIARVLEQVPRSQVHIVIFEEFFRDPARHFRELQLFLGLEPRHQADFTAFNVGRRPGNLAVHRLLSNPPPLLRPPYVALRALSHRFGLRFGRLALKLMNTNTRRREKISEALEAELDDYFRDDVARLETLLGRDLSIWKNRSAGHPDGAAKTPGADA